MENERLLQERNGLRSRVAELERHEADRERAEEALRKSEERYRLLANNSSDVIWTMTLDGRFTYASPSVTKLSGYTPEEVLEIPFHRYVVESCVEPVMAELAEQLQKPASERLQVFQRELQQYCKDGSIKDIEITAGWLLDDRGEPVGIQGSTRDITDRKKADERIGILADLIDIAPLSITVHDPRGRFLYANQKTFDLHGYSREEFFALDLHDLDVPASAKLIEARMREVMETGEAQFEVEHRRKDGTSFPLEVFVKGARWGGQDVLLSVASDITKRRKAEEGLRSSEFFMKEAERIARLGGWKANPHSDYLEWTEGVYSIVEAPPDYRPLLSEGLKFFEPEYIPVIEKSLADCLATGQPFVLECQIVTMGGRTLWTEVRGLAPVVEGERSFVVGTIQDITARKRSEQRLERINHTLLSLGLDFTENVNNLVRLCGEIFEADMAMYSRAEGAVLQSLGTWRTPPDMRCEVPLETSLCGQVLQQPVCEFSCLNDLHASAYSRTNPVIAEEGIYTYCGHRVRSQGVSRGVLCVLYKRDFHPTQEDIRLFGILATALGEEETRVQSQAALIENEERFRLLVKNSSDITVLVDPDGTERYCSDSLEIITGYTSSEVIGKSGFEFIHPKDRNVMRDAARQVMEEPDKAVRVEYRHRHKKGGWIHLEAFCRNQLANPILKSIVMNVRDITARKRAEAALKESEERFRALSENAPDIIYTMDLKGEITYANPSWTRILGHEPGEILGRYFIEFAREEDKGTYKKLFKTIRDGGISVTDYTGVIVARDGSERLFNMNNSFNRDSEGRMIGVVGTMKDITEQREMERKLNHAQKMEAIGTLAGGIAHDFNNLLMGIQGYASLMLLDLDPSHPFYERLRRIEEQVQSGTDLTRQLLGFAHGGRYESKPTDMNEIIHKSSGMFGRTKKEISIYRKYAEDLWSVEVDRGQMDQVFMNLYVNAWQAMPAGGEIYLETANFVLDEATALAHSVPTGRYVKITVTDTGMGMDEKTKERIFDPFFTTKAMGRGTGLGLAMVYGIVKGHGGMIYVDSGRGRGTSFTLYLPASDREVAKEMTETRTTMKGSETILLVDDEPVVAEVTRELLMSLGYRVHVAGSGQEAIAVYLEKGNGIDLVILDMIMPGLSGGETFDRLREIEPGVRVLLSSGYSINGEAKTIMDRGCRGFLQKPFYLETLSLKIREVLA
jgi:PAS domain S-box-containing protein